MKFYVKSTIKILLFNFSDNKNFTKSPNKFKIKPTISGFEVGLDPKFKKNHRYPCPYSSCTRDFDDRGNLKNHISEDHKQQKDNSDHNKAVQGFQRKSRETMVSLLKKFTFLCHKLINF